MNELWYPYAQMKTMSPPISIEEARGNVLITQDGDALVDGISSWWSTIHGYNHPILNEALTTQLEKMAHIMLGGLTHQPAQDLARKLSEILPGDLNHVFFSDSGSVGNEVAMKIAIQYWRNKGNAEKTSLLSLKKAYHGDTTGVMALSDPEDSMHHLFTSILLKHHFLDAPLPGFDASEEELAEDFERIRDVFEAHHRHIAALIVEPILQAAGGMNIYSPHYLAYFRALCDEFDVLLICDEVATGFGRTGTLFASEHAGIVPDIMVLGKGLTGGYLGLAATVSREHVYNAFLSDSWEASLMHGPTFMGNPLACAVSLASIEVFETNHYLNRIQQIETLLKEQLMNIDGKYLRQARVIGATGILEVSHRDNTNGFQEYARSKGVWLRPFGNFIYTMPSYISSDSDILLITSVMKEWVSKSLV